MATFWVIFSQTRLATLLLLREKRCLVIHFDPFVTKQRVRVRLRFPGKMSAKKMKRKF
jgi:hypothetical protein